MSDREPINSIKKPDLNPSKANPSIDSARSDTREKVLGLLDIVTFEKGKDGVIAKITASSKAWVVPGRKERHLEKPVVGQFLVEITGKTKTENLRFARVLRSSESLLSEVLSRDDLDIRVYSEYYAIIKGKLKVFGEELFFEATLNEDKICFPKFRWNTTGSTSYCNSQGKWEANLEDTTLDKNSSLYLRIQSLRAEYLEERNIRENEVKRIAQIEQEIFDKYLEEYTQNATSPVFDKLKQEIEFTKTNLKGSEFETCEDLGLSGISSSSKLEELVKFVSSGEVDLVRSESKKYRFRVLLQESHKKSFIEENPDCEIEISDEKFWEKACRQKGRYLSQSREYLGYRYEAFYNNYRLLIGGVNFDFQFFDFCDKDDE